jgi:RNA polymerase sigma factor (sigma-70 family)
MTDDTTLLQAFRCGDESAFAVLAERYHHAIHAACRRQAPNGEVEDCVQAVFLVLARRPAAAARSPVLLAWLHRVAHFVCRDARRAASRRGRVVTAVAQPPTNGHRPEAAVLEQLDAALLRLEDRQRAAVLLHVNGNPTNDIAERLGVTVANASKLVQRGLASLRERLAHSGVPVGASMLLAVMTTQASAATNVPPLTIQALNHASAKASLLAKGTLMHVTMTTASTWILAAGLATVLGVGALVASDAFSQSPTTPRPSVAAVTVPPQVPVPIPVLTEWEKGMEELLKQRLTFEFMETSSLDALNFLRQATGTTFIVHPLVLQAMEMTPLTLKAKDMSLRAVLNNLATIARVRYQIVDKAIFFSPLVEQNPRRAEEIERQIAQAVGAARDTTWGQNILQQLNQDVTLEFQDHDLSDVVDFLQKITNCNVILDPQIIAAPPAVTLRVKSMKLRLVLNHIMRMYSLRYQLRDEAVYIAPLEQSLGDVAPVTIKVVDMRAHDAANWLSTMTRMPISLDPSLADARVTFHFTDTEFAKVLDFLGAVLHADITPLPRTGGYHLTPNSTSAGRAVPASATTPVAPNAPVPTPGSMP